MKMKIILGGLLFCILLPFFIYLKMDSTKGSVVTPAPEVAEEEEITAPPLPVPVINPEITNAREVKYDNIKPSEKINPGFSKSADRNVSGKRYDEMLKDFFSIFKTSGRKKDEEDDSTDKEIIIPSTSNSPWQGETPTWRNKPIVGLRQTKEYYKPGDVGYFTYRNLKDAADYFKTIKEAEDAGYESARKKAEEGSDS